MQSNAANNRPKKENRFTLVDLLVVIVVLGILMVIVVSVVGGK